MEIVTSPQDILNESTAGSFRITSWASFSGTVRDTDGAALYGAIITAIHVNTKVECSVLTDEFGKYVIIERQPGKYTVRAEKEGYHASVKKDVVLLKTSKISLNFTLQAAP